MERKDGSASMSDKSTKQNRYPDDFDFQSAKLSEYFHGPRRPRKADAKRLLDQPIHYTKKPRTESEQ